MARFPITAHNRRASRGWINLWRLALVSLLYFASTAQAQDCSDYPNGTLDGFAGDIAPSQLQIDTDCTIRNYPASNPLRTNFSFLTQPGQTTERWLLVFDNVVHTGQMACNSVAGHIIWFTNGSSTAIQEGCQNLLIPVEKIDKAIPPGPATAAIGVPFTYTLKLPVLFDAGTGTVIDDFGSPNELHSITLWDDLNATGADLSYVSHVAYWRDTLTPVPHTFSNVGGLLTFDDFPIVPADDQIILELTVVLEDTPVNVPGTQFINTAKWDFGRLIDGEFFEPLPGEWGISEPLTIAAPQLEVTKTGPATLGLTLNLGEWGDFAIDAHNTGLTDAWNVTIVDELPNGPFGGMCNVAPEVQNVQVFAADGVTPVPGKGPLTEGVDYSLSFAGAPACELTLTVISDQGAIGPNERLVINYRTQLDSDSQDGVTLTNVAGATEWFNGDISNVDRVAFNRNLTNGTPGVLDHEDAHTVTVDLFGYFFEKSVENRDTGDYPATLAAPGDRLRYTLRLQTTDGPLSGISFVDDLGEMNALPVFEPGTLTLVPGTVPPTADTSNTDPFGGTNGTGVIDIRNLNLPADSEVTIQFDITLSASLIDGIFVTNQADLNGVSGKLADSDDPFVNGQSDPSVDGDEDPTQLAIQAIPPSALLKENTQSTATIGEQFSYRVTIPSTPHTAPLYDVRIIDDLSASAADLQFVSATRISGSGTWTPMNTGTSTSLVIEDPVNGIDIPIGEQVVVEITVQLMDTSTNVAGLTFTNTAGYTYNQLDNNDATQLIGLPDTTPPMTVVEPDLTLEKSGTTQMQITVPGTFTLDVHNIGDSPAYNLTITDVLPNQADGGMCDAAPIVTNAQLFEADGVTPVAPPLVSGTDFDVTFAPDPTCVMTMSMLTTTAAIGPDQRLLVTYEASLDADTQQDATLTNIAGATEWFSDDVAASNDEARTYSRGLTDGTPGVLDYQDAHTVISNLTYLLFEKTVANVTRGDDPATLATPGETLHYTLRIENTTDTPLNGFSIVDELDALNGIPSFQAGTLNVTDLPGTATDASDPNGGSNGTGLLDVRDLSIGGLGDVVTIEFDVVLAPAIPNGNFVSNQSDLLVNDFALIVSDDPNVNGQADPLIAGDEDPTVIQIESAPYFRVDKISSYVTGDPTVLLAGETLRYTISVQNVGTDHASGVEIVDQIPANTAYVAGSTSLNGVTLADVDGSSPLTDGILVNAPQDTTPGVMNAAVANNVATIVFDVVVDPNVVDGAIISNQAFLSALDEGLANIPSDDPRTAVEDDPTRDVVGAFPLLYAEKSAALEIDAGSPGIVDPGDVLRYTITIYNNGSTPATLVELFDNVPADTTYIADTTTLNGEPVGVPDNGDFPLESRLPVSSSDFTPPVPGADEGVLSPGESAVVQFDLQVNAAVATGTLITNQATVYSDELPNLLTDGDGNPATGPEPTVVVVGDAQQLSIAKEVAVVGGGPAVAGATLEYTVTVQNFGAVPALFVVITDDLSVPNPGYLTYVDQSATMNGLTDGVTFGGTILTADYSTINGPLEPGESIILRFRAVIDANLVEGTTITNTARVSWNDPLQWAEATVSIDVGGVPNSGILSGTIWHDADHDNTPDGVERLLEAWTVTLLRDGQPFRSTQTDVDGNYVFAGIQPNYLSGEQYALAFSAPGAVATTALMGQTDSDFTDGQQRIDDIVVQGGSNLRALNLPVDPNGVIYNSITRNPVSGASVSLIDVRNGQPVPADCFDDANQQGQVTVANGYYKFDINFSDPACPSGLNYLILTTVPDSSFQGGVSELIPPASDETTSPFDVPACPGSANDAVLATALHCEVQPSEFAPIAPVPVAGYQLFLTLDDTQVPGTSQLFNNHIPLDPRLDGAVSVTKTTPMLNVSRGDLVPYEITISNSFGADLIGVTIVDRYPAGFVYVEGSARFDDVATEPDILGLELHWPNLTLATDDTYTIRLLLAVGAGVTEGEFVNRAQAISSITGTIMSEEASATVRIVADPTFDCTDVTGKVYDDTNRNGYQDDDEAGLAGVRLVTAQGLAATTDSNGQYHITCAITPNESRGSNFVLKLDDRTLPSGFRPSTRPVQVQRATRGKALRINFGASIHRVVGLDIADAVFEPDSVEMRSQWKPRIDLLLDELQKGAAVLRLSYVADVESKALVERRLESIEQQIKASWLELNCCYELVIEPEIHWRLGAPPARPRGAN